MKKLLPLTRSNNLKENLVYLTLWGLLLLIPVFSSYVRSLHDANAPFSWTEIMVVWRTLGAFFVVFVIHNFLLAPLLVNKHRKPLYFTLVLALVALFALYHCSSDHHRPPMPGQRPEMNDPHRPPMPTDMGAPPQGKPFDMGKKGPGVEGPMMKGPAPGIHRPPLFFGEHDLVLLVVLVLMLGMNLGVKLYFKSAGDAKKMDELASKNLEQQLEYLKYQINPHFFMNTLNNIHALVDINPEKAKETILELSKLMRYVLYEGAKATVPLQREMDFLNNYITLMKIRYTDHVKISVHMPTAVPEKCVPPLLFITFVENAFKHGVSYRQESFIDVQMIIEGKRVKFVCRNSKIDASDDTHGGVGLANVRQRLQLIYEDDYTLDITDEAKVYDVRLSIPLLPLAEQSQQA